MSIRHTTKGRTVLTAVAITTGLVLTVAGCGGGDGDKDKDASSSSSSPAKGGEGEDDKQESGAPPAQQVLAEVKGGGLTLAVTSATRDGGGFVTVEGTVTNGSGKSWVAADWRGDERELAGNGGSIAGAGLIDKTGRKKYLVLRDTEGRCLCTRFTGGVQPGETTEWFAQFPAPPEGTNEVDFQVGAMPPASIDLSEGE
ncbi:hypothetical protein [Streptomyces fructofermentans]|uniref:Lipoprotein n=1 Tax=Streptomyces fructofermentans TaxID=152141 RepID=A0A918K070_9ACTN|nr:hypothetical protein [Streptomyces fructofermentans]GGX39820.1 hypothetical protein GCM10010515_02960 [Streptomyces fructofermentans]